MQRKYEHIVHSNIQDRQRLSKYIVGKFPFLETGSAVKKAIKRGEVFLNGRVGQSGDWVADTDLLEYVSRFEKPKTSTVSLDVLYEDDHLLVINKPPGMLSSGNSGRSLQSELMSYPVSDVEGSLFYPYLIHRLDRQTGGLIIAARTIESRRILGEMVDRHELVKEYSLIVQGIVDPNLKYINDEIDGKSAQTEILLIQNLDTKDPSTYIRLRLHTGRTHQIRRHFLSKSHPIVGDDVYNAGGLSFGRGLFLMADYLKFLHPISKEKIIVKCELHNKFSKYLQM